MTDIPDEIPPFLRLPPDGSRERTEWVIRSIDVKIAKLAGLGLRPHPNMLEYRAQLVAQIDAGGPYWIHYTRMLL